jgi:hypothetical protein
MVVLAFSGLNVMVDRSTRVEGAILTRYTEGEAEAANLQEAEAANPAIRNVEHLHSPCVCRADG